MKSIYSVRLTDQLASSDSSSTISNVRFRGGAATFTDESCVLTNDDQSIFELVVASSPGDGTVTFSMRGLNNSSEKVEVSGNKQDWGVGTLMYITALASDFPDLSSDNIFTGWNQFEGSTSFSGTITSTGVSVDFDYLDVNVNLGIPVFASTAARDIAIPTPTGKELCKVSGDVYSYNALTAQWEILDVGTPTPNGSTTVAGKFQEATDTQVGAGTQVGSTGAHLVINPTSTIKQGVTAATVNKIPVIGSDLTINDYVRIETLSDYTYLAGEAITSGNALFIETPTTFALATTTQNIGDTSANTRYGIAQVGAGVSASTLKLSLAKQGTPGVALEVRVETDNAGSPSGTLVDANATGTVAQAGLSGSLADTTVTFAGSFTVASGTPCWVVARQVGDVVSGSNYYQIGTVKTKTSTRVSKLYGGASWTTGSTVATDSSSQTYTSAGAGTTSGGWYIQANVNSTITAVTRDAISTGTRCRIFTSGGGLLATSTTLSGNTFTGFSQAIVAGTQYIIEIDASGGSYTVAYVPSLVPQPIYADNISFISGSNGQSPNTEVYNIASVTSTATSGNDTITTYVSSNLFTSALLSLTNSNWRYKSDLFGIADTTVAIGTAPKVNLPFGGINNKQTSLTYGSDYYLTTTAGGIGTTAGNRKTYVGNAVSTTQILMRKRLIWFLNQSVGASPYTFTNTSNTNVKVTITGGTVSVIAYSRDGVNYYTRAVATNNDILLGPGDSTKVTYSVIPAMNVFYM